MANEGKKQRFRKVKQKGHEVSHVSEERQQSHYPYAPASLKIKAFITDSFMLLMPIMYIVFYLVMGGREGFAEARLFGWLAILIPLVTVQTLFMLKRGQTPGYRAYDLTVVDIATGKKPSTGILLLRNVAALLSFFTIFGWVMLFFRRDRKTLHDLLSGTAVIVQTPDHAK